MCGLNIYIPWCTTLVTVFVIFVSFNFSFIGIRVQKVYIHHTVEEVMTLLGQRGKDVVYAYKWYIIYKASNFCIELSEIFSLELCMC